jgi:hypothetical protein
MENGIIDNYLSRILSGYLIFNYNNKFYKLIYPNIDLKYKAELYAQEEYENNKYNDWISEEQVNYFLMILDLWSPDMDTNLKNIEKKIEDLKVELYNNFLNPSAIKNIKRNISNYKKNQENLLYRKHYLDNFTHKGYVSTLKNQYLLIHSLYNDKDEKYFSYPDIDYNTLNFFSSIISHNQIDISIFRIIARHEKWKNYWSTNKENIFNKSVIDWTVVQRTLVIFTKFYDSAFENSDCPPDSVINDDDMFDGWLIIQKRASEKQKEKNRAEKLLEGKNIGNAKEVFLVAKSQEEAQNIYNLNDSNSRHIIRERNRMILNSNKEIKETELPDVQRDLQIQNNQQFIKARKSK